MVAGESQNLYNLQISSVSGAYEIVFTNFDSNIQSDTFYIVDSFFQKSLKLDSTRVVYIQASEEAKTLNNAETIMVNLSNKGMTKKHSLVVIGGGCVQDIGTLVASLYMRGIEWTFVPTTLAAMGDSCIGGKSSINVGPIKNLVGNFYPPKRVIVDSKFCQTLPNLELIAGISEIIKICFARSENSFRQSALIASLPNLKDASNSLNELVYLSLSSKKYFIEADEFDTGIRKLLNFGHSFGHALESASNYQIPHGVAVMLGMLAATHHPAARKTGETTRLRDLCLEFLKQVSMEIENPLKTFAIADFSSALKMDKKNTLEDLVLVLPSKAGLILFSSPFSKGAIEHAQIAMESARKEVLSEIR